MKIYQEIIMVCEDCPAFKMKQQQPVCTQIMHKNFKFKKIPSGYNCFGKFPKWCPLKDKVGE